MQSSENPMESSNYSEFMFYNTPKSLSFRGVLSYRRLLSRSATTVENVVENLYAECLDGTPIWCTFAAEIIKSQAREVSEFMNPLS